MSLRSVTRKFKGKEEEPNEELQGSQMFLFWAVSFLTPPPIVQIIHKERIVIIIIILEMMMMTIILEMMMMGLIFPSCEQKEKTTETLSGLRDGFGIEHGRLLSSRISISIF